jgi:hypothetical protein
MAVTFKFPENRLAKIALAPGGVRHDEALAAAKANLEVIQDDCVREVDRSFLALKQSAASPDAASNTKVQRRIYAQSNRIAGTAGSCGLPAMGEAAFSLCELVDRQIQSGGWNAEAVAVLIDGMALLRAGGAQLPVEGQKQILAGLRDVATRARLQTGASNTQ